MIIRDNNSKKQSHEEEDNLVVLPGVEPRLPSLEDHHFREIEVRFDRDDQIFWCFMNQKCRPSYTYSLGEEIQIVQDWVHDNFAQGAPETKDMLRYFICGSRTPGIYNLGGDLKHFAQCIKKQDHAELQRYARTCVEMQYANSIGYGAPVITMALVQGDALGGGFEHAMAFDILVAEKSARMGLPEILFNLFPGMGAYSFLRRRLGRKETEAFILEGKLFTATELYEMGVVDILADDGMGEAAIIAYIEKNSKRFHAERAVYRARRANSPVTLEELIEITDIWAETAMQLDDADVRKMERLAAAQDRRIQKSLNLVKT